MASPNCTNTDISGIGVRSATYAQNLLSFVPAAVALLNDGKISNNEREFIKDQSTNILLTAFGLLLSAIIQAKTDQGLDNYHLALVLNLSWMNNTNTFIYLVLFLHRKIWSSSPGEWSLRAVVGHLFPQSSKGNPKNERAPGDIERAGESGPAKAETEDETAQGEPEPLLDFAVGIGSLHLSLMGAVGVWLWANPLGFGSSPSCPPDATISVLSRTFPMASPGLRIISLMFYAAVLIPIVNLVLPTALVLTPYLLCPLGQWSDPKKRESVAVRCVALGLILLFAINVIFIVDTELAISRNESRQAGQDKLWTLGQTLALLLLVLPIRGLLGYLLTTTSLVLPIVGETPWGRAVRGFRTCDKDTVSWSEVYRRRWLIGDTPVKVDSDWLLHALIDGQLDIERFLCENGADWATVLVRAAEQDRAEIVRSVIKRGVDVESAYGKALCGAAWNGHLEIVRFLVEKAADINSRNGEPLRYATATGHLEMVCFLVEKGADVNSNDGEPLCNATVRDDLEIVRFLVEKGADINSNNRSPLQCAAVMGHLEVVHFLVEKGADINSNNGKPLCYAAERGNLEVVCFLVEKGADINCNNGKPLCYAAERGRLEIVRFLVEKGADINSNNGEPLCNAARNGHLEVVRFLVEKGADINSRNGKALCDAASNGHLEVVHFLVEKGADINNDNGESLRSAASNGHLEIVHFLVENGADINSRNGEPLCGAAWNGHLEVVRFLVEKGADVNRKNQDYGGHMPLDMAIEQRHTEIVSLLRNNGAVQMSGRIRGILTAPLLFSRKLVTSVYGRFTSQSQSVLA
ncbi:Multiple ankyrin repeats single kh domain [Mycena venus]|uniref:Multiple ankyrin repeats single kh domain n=1 Tax=Mycena venus TaxID=2733690 RepID=A0A8H6XT05_9AGAR|nr:Multiple ankyrin repeats single kh domain [Mycena venus]